MEEKNFTGPVTKKQNYIDQEIGEFLNFYGVVKDNKSLNVEYAIVMVFVCLTGGIEKPIAHTFTDKEGRYFISIPKPPDNNDLLGFKVRASKPHIHSKTFNYPVNCKKEQYKELEPDTVQPIVENCMLEQNKIITCNIPGQDKISSKKNFFLPAKSDGAELINLAKAGDNEYYNQPSEGVVFVEPSQPPGLEDALQIKPKVETIKKVENASRKSEVASTTYFLLLLSLFGILIADELKLQRTNAEIRTVQINILQQLL